MKKRLFSWLLVLAMVLSMMPTVAFATEGEEPAPVVIFSEDFSGYETGATYDPEAEGATLIPYDGDFTITNAPDILGAAKILRVSLVGDYNAATNDARLMLNKIVGGSFKLEAQVYGNGGSYYTDVTLSGVQKGGKAIIVRFYNNGNIATVADGATTVFHAAAEDIDADGDLYEDNDKAYTNLTVIVDADAGTVNIATKRNGANGVTEGSATIEGATVANGRVIFDIRTKNGSTRQARFDNIKVYCLHAEGDQVVTEAKLPTCAEAGASTGVVCDRCDTVLEEPIVLDPLTHDLVQVGAQAPTKETAGWDAYEYCNNCDYTTYAEIPALGSPAVVFSETFDNDTGAEIIYVPTAEGAVLEPYNKNESNFVATPEPRITAAGALAVFLTGDYASGTNAARLQLSKVVGGSYELGLRVYGNAAGDHTRVALTGATKNDAAVELRFYKNGAVTLWNGTEHAVVYEGNADDKTWADLKFTVDADAGTVGVLCTRGETVLVDTTLEEVTVANGRLLLDVRGKGEAIRQARFDDIVVKCLHAATDVVTFEAQDPTCTEPGTSAGEKCDRCETVFVATETTEALGHTLVQVEAQAPTTEAIGWEAYEYCTACDYTTYVEIPKVEVPESAILFKETFDYEAGTYDPTAEGAPLIPYGTFATTIAPELAGGKLRVFLAGDYASGTNDARLMLNKVVGGSFKLEMQVYGNGSKDYTTITLTGVTVGGKAVAVRFYSDGNIATVVDGVITVFHAKTEDVDADGDLHEDNDKAYTNLTVIVDADAGTVNIATERAGANGITEGSATIEGATVANGRVVFDIRTKNDSTRQVRFDDIVVTCRHAETDKVTVEAKDPTCTEAGITAGVKCDRCETAFEGAEVIEALGHNIIQVEAQAPTTTTVGWDAYEYCDRCDYTTYVELPKLGSPVVIFSETFDNDTGANITYDPTAEGATLIPYNANGWHVTTEPYIHTSGYLAVFLTGAYASGTNAARLMLSKVIGGSYELSMRIYGNGTSNYTGVALTGVKLNDTAVELRFYNSGGITVWNGTEHAVMYEGTGAADDKTWADLKFTVDADAGTIAILCTRGETELINTTLEGVTVVNGRLLLDVRGKNTSTRQARFDDIVVTCLHGNVDRVAIEAQDATCTEGGTTAGVKCDRCETIFEEPQTSEALGHNIIQVEAQEPTAEANGWEAYEYCTRCDYSTYVEVEYGVPCITFFENFEGDAYVVGEDMPLGDAEGATFNRNGAKNEYTITTADINGKKVMALYAGGSKASTAQVATKRGYGGVHDFTFKFDVRLPSEANYYASVKFPYVLLGKDNAGNDQVFDLRIDANRIYLYYKNEAGTTVRARLKDAGGNDVAFAVDTWATIKIDVDVEGKTATISQYTSAGELQGTLTQTLADVAASSAAYMSASSTVDTPSMVYFDNVKMTRPAHAEVVDEAVEATCTETGLTEGLHCSACDMILTPQEEIPALGHDLITVPAQEPTTEAAGWNEYQMCSRCDYTEGYVEIPKLEEPEVPQPELYTVTIADGIKNGTVTVDVTEGEVGTLVTVTATPAAGTKAGKYYDLIGITVNGQFIEGNTFEITAGENVVSAIFGKALITAKSLQLKEQVYVKVNTQFVGFDVDVIENGGLLVWDTPVETPYYDEAAAITGFELASSYDNGFGELDEFVVKTNGISAKEYADELYMCAYIEIADGVYAFSDVQEYSVQIYCQNQLKKATAAEKLKQVCAQMLHYGAAAQVQFKHNTTDLANDVAKVSELANYPAGEWNDSLLDTLKTIPTTAFEQNEEIYRTASTLRLKDATIVNVTFRNNEDFDRENGGKAEMLFWYDKNGTLTELVDLSGQDGIDENLFYVVDLTYTGVYAGTGDHEFTADAKGLPAKEYGNTLFACPKFTDAEGNVTYGTVYAYSVETYAQSQINKTSAAETLKAVCKQLVIYGEAAKNYFGN